ncbi:MAG: ComEA family DNA-binding protein [Armatimonadetes bacterium]|nr:ComEA family DNA-binding protein [Armatimonadota bacterium]
MEFSRPQKLLIAVGLLGVVGGVVLLSLQRLARPAVPTPVVYTPPPAPVAAGRSLNAVHVAGEVRTPGLYWLPPGARVGDAIRAAGGQTALADMTSVNLAAPVQDGSQVIVGRLRTAAELSPVKPAPVSPSQPMPAPQPRPATPTSVTRPVSAQPAIVSLNQATPEQLEALPGIGQELARRILYYRYEHGGFRSVDQLAEVEGIGPQRLEQLRPYVRP